MKHDEQRTQRDDTPHYDDPTGGWGSVKGMLRLMSKERPDPGVLQTLARMNKPKGHMCTACAWAKPADPSPFEICENGAKATVWDLTDDRCTPEFFAEHSVATLRHWSDHDLELVGRLTHPMRYDAASDHYVPCSWQDAFDGIARELRALEPKSVVFYASGRASLETSYLWALFARLYGHNNLPDSSNMCHETTSVGLKKLIGSSVGTCVLSDFERCDLILFFGQNTGTNSPRFLNVLREASRRGCRIVTFNPVRERGLIEFADPKNPVEMLTGATTTISDLYLQVKPGGDIAALAGVCKCLLALERERGDVLDRTFIDAHTAGFEEFVETLEETSWHDVEAASGLTRGDLEEVGRMYAEAERSIGIYGMGLTQHVHGFQNLAMLTALLLLKGNIGREGTGISPVRGHSNVQGQRTVGISEKPKLVPLDRLAEQFGFEPPREQGRTTVEAVEGVLDGSVKGFVSLGGNFARAIPDQGRTDPAWAKLALNVQVATKLNRSHLLVGKSTWLLPCLVRAEEDRQASGPQAVSMEDSLSHIHGSIGKRAPASEHLLSELAIVAGMAEATLEPNPKVRWDDWTADYALVRDLIAETYPDEFRDFNARLFTPGGFYRGNAARERRWETDSGKANFVAPTTLTALGQVPRGANEFTLVTLRSNDQFNTTVYGFSDRLRGLEGSRDIVLINPEDMRRAGLVEGQRVTLECAVTATAGESDVRDDDADTVGATAPGGNASNGPARSATRSVAGLRVVPYDLPDGCLGAYYPETNALVPLGYHDVESKTPAYKGTPVRVMT